MRRGAWLSRLLRLASVCALTLSIGNIAMAANQEHKVVIEVVSSEPKQWEKLMNNVENVQKAFDEKVEIEVVAHGEGLKLLVKNSDPIAERMKKASNHNVKFAACQNTMTRQNITKAQLQEFAVTVDSGVAEVIRKQEDRWSYIRN